jgi:hypothetical protein
MENVGIFYAHLEYVMEIWYILWSMIILWQFGLGIFGILCQEKSGNPGFEAGF